MADLQRLAEWPPFVLTPWKDTHDPGRRLAILDSLTGKAWTLETVWMNWHALVAAWLTKIKARQHEPNHRKRHGMHLARLTRWVTDTRAVAADLDMGGDTLLRLRLRELADEVDDLCHWQRRYFRSSYADPLRLMNRRLGVLLWAHNEVRMAVEATSDVRWPFAVWNKVLAALDALPADRPPTRSTRAISFDADEAFRRRVARLAAEIRPGQEGPLLVSCLCAVLHRGFSLPDATLQMDGSFRPNT